MRSMIHADAAAAAAREEKEAAEVAVVAPKKKEAIEAAMAATAVTTAPVSRCVSETSEALASSAKKTLGEYCAMLCCDVVC
jgi:hypothetical protein